MSALYVKNIPPELLNQAKIAALKSDMPLYKWIIAVVEHAVMEELFYGKQK